MKKILFLLVICLPAAAIDAQLNLNLGLKAGLNFANITSTAGFSNSSRTGHMVGGYIAPKAKKLFGFRSEIILSRQGYDYKTNTNTGNVNLDYLLLPQLLTINLGKRIQFHAGGQIAFLLNANVDSTGGNTNNGLLDYFNRFDYAAAGGIEIFPISGFFVGGRINISFNSINEEPPIGGNWPSYIPRLTAKNNVVQLYAGWRF